MVIWMLVTGFWILYASADKIPNTITKARKEESAKW